MSLTRAQRIILERRLAQLERRRSRGGGILAGILAGFFLAPVLAVLLGAIGAGLAYVALAEELEAGLEKIDEIGEEDLFQTSWIYDRNGEPLREVFGEGKRTYMPLDEIPEQLRQATIAVEDADFYENPGIDAMGIARAAYGVATNQPGLGGGSTITQQLVRNVAFSYEERIARSYERKLKEIVLAVMMTRQYSKDQILEWYMNVIYYGNLAYGVEAAAQTIYGKTVAELNLAESALMAGLPKAPRDLDPLNPDPDVQSEVRRRQRIVLDLMLARGFITEDAARRAAGARLRYRDPDDNLFVAPHFVVYAGDLIEEMVGAERLALGGLSIYTTLDLRLQELAEEQLREQVDRLRDRHDLTNAALVAMEPATGQVLAMVGSYDYWDDEIDGRVNVALRERQPGSSIKPVTYLTALEQGVPSSQIYWDVPMQVPLVTGIYEPVNYDERFHGPVRMRRALGNSYNIPALKALALIPLAEDEGGALRLGVEQTIDTAHDMGIQGLNRGAENYGLSLTLGGGEVTLLDMTTVYGTLANLGQRVDPQPILRITDREGNILFDLRDEAEDREDQPDAVDPRAAYIIADMLSDNEARQPSFGTNNALNIGVTAAAKTGTTNDYRDNWTLGFTPYLVTGVWAGNSDNTPMRNSSGLTGAGPIWNGFMRRVAGDPELRGYVAEAREAFGLPLETSFRRPEGIVEREICRIESLRQPSAGCPVYEVELFLEEHAPEEDSGWTMTNAVVVALPPEQLPPPIDPETGEEWEEDDPRRLRPPFLVCDGEMGHGGDKQQALAVIPLPQDDNLGFIGEEQQPTIDWSLDYGWPTLYPFGPCTPEMAGGALAPGSIPAFAATGILPEGVSPYEGFEGQSGYALPATYRLSIEPDALVTERTVLTGTVLYNPEQIEYFKVELGSGRAPRDWFTLGDIHEGPVVDGTLEVLDAPSLAPGFYVLRLVLVKRDGNVLEPPHSVPIEIGRSS